MSKMKFTVSIGEDGDKPLVLKGEIDSGGERVAPCAIPVQLIATRPEVYDLQGNRIMSNIALLNTQVLRLRILALDSDGNAVPIPAGDVPSVVSSDPTKMAATIDKMSDGGACVMLNALVRTAPGLSYTLTDSAGLTSFTDGVDISGDLTATSLGVDLAASEISAQAEPAA